MNSNTSIRILLGRALHQQLTLLKESVLTREDPDVLHHKTGEVVRLELASFMFLMDREKPSGWTETREGMVRVFNGLAHWANNPRQKEVKTCPAKKETEAKRKRVFGDCSSSSSEPDERSLREMLEEVENEVPGGEREGEKKGGETEGEQEQLEGVEDEEDGCDRVSTQIEGHEENQPEFDISPV